LTGHFRDPDEDALSGLHVATDGRVECGGGDEPDPTAEVEVAVVVDAVLGRRGVFVIVAGEVVVALHDGGLYRDRGDHAVGRVRTDAAVIVVGARYGERDGAHAHPHGVAGHHRQGEGLRVAERHAAQDADVAVHVVGAAFIHESDGLTGVDVERGGVEVEIPGEDGVIGSVTVGLCTKRETRSEQKETRKEGYGQVHVGCECGLNIRVVFLNRKWGPHQC